MEFKFYVCAEHPGNPLQDALVLFEPKLSGSKSFEFRTDEEGEVSAKVPTAEYSIVVSADDFYPVFIGGAQTDQTIVLEPLPKAENYLGWWHRALRVPSCDMNWGEGITIGIIDSGYSKRPDSAVKDCGSVQNGEIVNIPGIDTEGHGTAVASLIGGRPDQGESFAGVAPGALLYSIKTFDARMDKVTTGTASEIEEAIYHLVNKKKVDLINCSFEHGDWSHSVAQQIEEAFNKGVLCICAAGNNALGVAFPARMKNAVSVGALGLVEMFKSLPIMAYYAPERQAPDWSKEYFIASFSGRGEKIDCCAPGVGIIAASLPRNGRETPFQFVSGTSFATPLVCGLLAAVLGRDEVYKKLPRDARRAEHAMRKLQSLCETLKLDESLQGRGLPFYS